MGILLTFAILPSTFGITPGSTSIKSGLDVPHCISRFSIFLSASESITKKRSTAKIPSSFARRTSAGFVVMIPSALVCLAIKFHGYLFCTESRNQIDMYHCLFSRSFDSLQNLRNRTDISIKHKDHLNFFHLYRCL